MTEWRFGFSTAIELYGNYKSAVGYVCKYISKETEKIGGRWYYSGGALKRPDVVLTDVDFNQFLSDNVGTVQTFQRGGLDFAVLTLGGD